MDCFYLVLLECINYFIVLILSVASTNNFHFISAKKKSVEAPRLGSRWNSDGFGADPFQGSIIIHKCSQMRGTELNVSKRSKLDFFLVKKKKNLIKIYLKV